MAIPDPEIGLVIHFNYLWKREHEIGRENARYARPCASAAQVAGGIIGVTSPIFVPFTR